jgi:hypothetical protein
MSGTAIAADVAAALKQAANATGNGAQAILLRSGAQPANPWDAPAMPGTSQEVWAISENYSARQIDGTLIRAEDRRVMIEAVTPAPTTADRLSIGGAEYAIVSVQPESPGGVPLYYTCQCRK